MIWLRKNWKLASAFACLGSATAAFVGRDALARVAGVPVHYASHQLCSASFVAGLDPAQFFDEAIKPKLGPIGGLLQYDIDREHQEVRTSLAGLVHSRAVYDVGHSVAAFFIPGMRRVSLRQKLTIMRHPRHRHRSQMPQRSRR